MQKAYDKMSPRCCRHFLRYGIRLKRLKEQNAKSMRGKNEERHCISLLNQKKKRTSKVKKIKEKNRGGLVILNLGGKIAS